MSNKSTIEGKSIPTEEYCPYCNDTVELPPHLGIYKCPTCGKMIIACSMCETQNCHCCEYEELTKKQEAK